MQPNNVSPVAKSLHVPGVYSFMFFATGHKAALGEWVSTSNFAVFGPAPFAPVAATVNCENIGSANAPVMGLFFVETKVDFSSAIVKSPVVNFVVLPVLGVGVGVTTTGVTTAGVTTGVAVAHCPAFTPHTPPWLAKLNAEPSPVTQPESAVEDTSSAIGTRKRMIHIQTDPEKSRIARVVLILR